MIKLKTVIYRNDKNSNYACYNQITHSLDEYMLECSLKHATDDDIIV